MTRGARWPIALWILGLAACVGVISRTEFGADLSAFLPRSPSPAQQLLVDQLKDGVVSRLVLIGIEGTAADKLVRLSKGLTDRLAQDANFVYAHNGEDVRLKRDWDFLLANRYLLSSAVTPQHFSVPSLREALEANLDLLGSPAGMLVEQLIPHDPTGEVLHLQEQLQGASRPATRDGVWFSPGGERALVIAQTHAPGFDIDAQQRALAAIRHAFAAVTARSSSTDAKLLVSGPGIFSVHSRESIRQDAMRLSAIATVLIAAVLLTVYRSPRALVLSFVPVVTGALAGIAAVRLVFGEVHGITLGFGVTLIGEAVDYPVYLFTGVSAQRSSLGTLERLWPTLRLGVLTSICGFSAMVFSGFPGLAQLGVFSIAGLIAAVALTRWVLPSLLPMGFRVQAVDTLAARADSLVRRATALRAPAVVLVVACAVFLGLRGESMWNDRLESLNPISEKDQQLDALLRQDLGAPDARHMLIVSAADEQSVLELAENIEPTLRSLIDSKAIAGFDSPARFLPSHATQSKRRAALPEIAVLRKNLDEAVQDLPYWPDLFEPFFKQVEAVRNGALVERANLKGTTLATRVDSLLVKRKDRWSAILPLQGVADAGAVATAVAKLNNANVVVLDLKEESDLLYKSYRTRAMIFALIGAAVITVLLLLALRSLKRTYAVLIPLAAAVVVTCTLLLVAGHRLTLFDLVALLLVVGVGSNYSLFFDRENVNPDNRGRTSVSLALCNLSTVIAFGLLAFSRTPVLSGIGATVAIGAFLSLVFSAILTARPLQSPQRDA